MSNFEYILSSLPLLTADFKYAEGAGFQTVLDEIRRDLSEADTATVEFLLRGFDDGQLDEDFYAAALRHRNRFIREYFRFDLNLRNAKVRYLNQELQRSPGQDVMTGENPDAPDTDIDGFRFTAGEFQEAAVVENALASTDLVSREKALDDILWKKVDDLVTFHYFDLEAVLGYIAKLHIVNRWLALDETAGRERFHQLVEEVRGTFKGVEYTEQ
ncbi:MAG: DUF2764 family protein [Bacteroidales bacterium]|nr:DUF2764 family protein [Bacteroidales bacterium]